MWQEHKTLNLAKSHTTQKQQGSKLYQNGQIWNHYNHKRKNGKFNRKVEKFRFISSKKNWESDLIDDDSDKSDEEEEGNKPCPDISHLPPSGSDNFLGSILAVSNSSLSSQ